MVNEEGAELQFGAPPRIRRARAAVPACPPRPPRLDHETVGRYGVSSGNLTAEDAAMNKDLKYPNWQEPLIAAILESNPSRLFAKIQKAEAAIDTRFQELAVASDSLEESRLLSDGRSILQDLEKIACL